MCIKREWGYTQHHDVATGSHPERFVPSKVGNMACPKNLGPTVSCDGVNCPPFSTRVRESRRSLPRVPGSPPMGGRAVSLSVVIWRVSRVTGTWDSPSPVGGLTPVIARRWGRPKSRTPYGLRASVDFTYAGNCILPSTAGCATDARYVRCIFAGSVSGPKRLKRPAQSDSKRQTILEWQGSCAAEGLATGRGLPKNDEPFLANNASI